METLPSPEDKPRAVRDMFDRIAPRYDRVNRVMTGRADQRWRRSLLARLEPGPSDRILDLACGTGDFAELALQYTKRTWGLDFSRGMLEGAQRRGLGRAGLVQGDALRMPFADGAFTLAVSGFALRNFASIPPVLAELARVLEPGGRIGLLEVDRPRNPLLRAGHAVYFDRVVPVLGGLISRDAGAYRYLPASASYLPEPRELAAMLRAAGFHRLHKRRAMGGAIQLVTAVRE
ncbi:MAG: ubiquinone/menaquinone biosynthesis methyltransferase [Dehalococcoidia bacterium]|nr:ubiquinone/menaquinone biosynthesis methyltransferase [Dehalococcoidia bacterium]